ncbi:MAG: hypothetical protein KF841_03085 [Phycisphaerae bacterium]|nr:hypothetical protein [Phycisphaerae bacterium]
MVEPARPSGVRINAHDARILGDHVGVFRMTTYEALRRVYWPDGEIDAAKSWVRRMKSAGYLRGAPLYGNVRYFYPSHQAVTEFRLEPGAQGFQRPTRLAEVYGRLAFCCLGERPYRLLSPSVFCQEFPELVIGKKIPEGYYLDDSASRRRLGYIFVDTRREPRAIRARLKDLISERIGNEAWKHNLIRPRLFLFAIVTIRERAAKQIARYLDGLHPEIEFRFAHFPELGELLPTERGNASQA